MLVRRVLATRRLARVPMALHTAAAVVRVLAPAWPTRPYAPVIVLPAALWRAAFVLFLLTLGCAGWSRKRCIQTLQILRRKGHRKRHSVFLDVRGSAGLGNCNNVAATDHPGQRDRGGRAAMASADLGQGAVTDHEVFVPAEGRISHHRDVVLLAPRQQIVLNFTVVGTVGDLVRSAA